MVQLKASVIVPVLNEGKAAVKTIKSLLNQDFRDYEVIVVDSSDDGTYSLLKNIKGIVLLRIPKKGIAHARNTGLKKSRGELIAFLDCGFVAGKGWLKKITDELMKSKASGIGGSFYSKRKGWVSRFMFEDRAFRLGGKKRQVDILSTNNSAFCKRDLAAVGGFDENFSERGEDSDICYRLTKLGKKLFFEPKVKAEDIETYKFSDFFSKQFKNAKWHVSLYKKHIAKSKGDSFRSFSFLFQTFLPALLLLVPFRLFLLPTYLFLVAFLNLGFILSRPSIANFFLLAVRPIALFLGAFAGLKFLFV